MLKKLIDSENELVELMSKGRLIIFVGSGISIDSKLPDWDGLLLEFIEMAESLNIPSAQHKAELKKLIEDSKGRLITKSKEGKEAEKKDPDSQIKIATVIKRKLIEAIPPESKVANAKYKNWLNNLFLSAEPNSKHYDIVKANYPYILTTNYDLLLETAAENIGALDIASNSFIYKEETEIVSSIYQKKPAIIHIHGAVGQNLGVEEIIFTKEDYNKIIRKKFEGFSFALRMLFTSYSTLFVGYGASDPHLEDIAEELAEYYPPNADANKYPMPKAYLVTKEDKADSVLEKWKDRMRTDVLTIKDYSEYDHLLEKLKKCSTRDLEDNHQNKLFKS
jgi:hypothetical protein